MNALHAASLLPCFSYPSPWTTAWGSLGLVSGANTDMTIVATTTTTGCTGPRGGPEVEDLLPGGRAIQALPNVSLTSHLWHTSAYLTF